MVLDRSYLTFAAYEYAKGNKKGLTEFYRMFSLYKDRVMIPKYIIFLMVNPDIRIQRITHRGDKDLPDYSMVHKKFNDNLMQYFRMQSHVKVFFIDTTSKTPDNVLSEALNIIESQ